MFQDYDLTQIKSSNKQRYEQMYATNHLAGKLQLFVVLYLNWYFLICLWYITSYWIWIFAYMHHFSRHAYVCVWAREKERESCFYIRIKVSW